MRRLALKPGLAVFGITRNEFSAEPLRHDGYDVRVGSVGDPEQCRRLIESADVVINAALHIGLPNFARSQNQSIIRNLLRESDAPLVHFSSVAVYGSCHASTHSTFESPRGDSTYAREKLQLERYAAALANSAGRSLTILRLGHVYGTGQGISKQIFSDLELGGPALPFDGELPSNALNVDRLADAIAGSLDCVTSSATTTSNAVDAPQSTWRELYDLHSAAAGLALAPGMSNEDSIAWQASFRKRAARSTAGRFAEAVYRWLRSVPLNTLSDAQGVRELMDRAMLALPPSFEQRVFARYQNFAAQHRVAARSIGVIAPPWYFSEAVPGPNLMTDQDAQKLGATRRDESRDLAAWYRRFAAPDWTVPPDSRSAVLSNVISA